MKETKISMLVHHYEMFKTLDHENIDKIAKRFMHIINQRKTLGKRYSNAEMVKKVLRSLLFKAWHPRVIAIQEDKDLNMLNLNALIGSLKTHEIKLNVASKETNRRAKSIALKSTHRRSRSFKAMKASIESDEEV